MKLSVAVIHGLGNIREVLEDIERETAPTLSKSCAPAAVRRRRTAVFR